MNYIIPYTTPAWTATINAVADELEKVIVTFQCNGIVVLEKEYTEFYEYDDSHCSFTVALSQEDTLLFKNNTTVTMQLNALFKDMERQATLSTEIYMSPQLHRKVMNANE